jgi:hypothetical protein
MRKTLFAAAPAACLPAARFARQDGDLETLVGGRP